MAQKTYWKVVFLVRTNKNLDGRMFSAVRSCIPNSHASTPIVEYKRGQWTLPKIEGSRLFIFGSKRAAMVLAEKYRDYRIYKCKVKDVKKQPTALRRLNSLLLDDVRIINQRIFDFWNSDLEGDPIKLVSSYSASAVKIYGDPIITKFKRHRP